jgi:outer membrane protein OmpA-like peptidoglycan-associated protein
MKKTLPWSERYNTRIQVRRDGITLAFVALLCLAGTGCSNLSNTQSGALIGAGAGGALGAIVGNATGSTARGAIIGAAVGGAAGAIIGSRMNDRADTLERELSNATIERVGEGILVTFDSGILFGFDSSNLQAQARNNLSDLARVLAEDWDDYELLVAGHTDDSGAEVYNQRLSERRASAASDFLATHGIPGTQIRVQGLGEMEPVASNETPSGQEANRRVEIAIFASAKYRNEASRQARN